MNEHGLPPADERDQLIAEYALGVLTGEERARVEAMAAQDPNVQAAIVAWQSHFDCWLDQLPQPAHRRMCGRPSTGNCSRLARLSRAGVQGRGATCGSGDGPRRPWRRACWRAS
ncbi:hypothetical protein [Pseudomonas sp. KNUC1026]|uniref:hypothetical protein n=1 Tax=Pseudomonas sp. KNUC1026 TaxID=2893890 RepID=UPI001F28F7D4|nr:hypothetical protein [Pseudomonas sp. KNUC1026]UFH51801.1 hypothetical protein LN139_14190 [Pseudomonas sp. KNUC1026]